MKFLKYFLLLILIISGCSKNNEDIKFGAVLPLSGEVASYGNDSKEGIDLALEIANKNQDKYHFVVKYQDSQGDPKTAVTSLQQLLTDSNIKAVVGENISSSTLAMVPIIDRKGIILISPSASTPKLSGASKYFFRVFPSDVAEGAFVANKIDERHPNGKVCIMYFNNDYGLGLTNVFKDEANKIGLNVLEVFAYTQDATNFKTILSKIKQHNPDAVYIAGYYKDAGNILKQAKELNIHASFWGATTMEDPQLLTIAGEAAEGFKYPVSTGYDPKDSSQVVQEFIKLFKEKYNKEPGLVAALGYDCAKLLIDATLSKGYSPEKIREFMLGVKDYSGAAGKMTFDVNGDVKKSIQLKVVSNKTFSIVKD